MHNPLATEFSQPGIGVVVDINNKENDGGAQGGFHHRHVSALLAGTNKIDRKLLIQRATEAAEAEGTA